ncbi:rhomboid family intramembrane serine protease [candidate division KSB1 bacterium]|nr:MAG: rhomboid family intramembrane serine protease [candidate division KSB1 bacterium]
MIPIRDENPTRRTPYVTVSLIAINSFVFIYQFLQPSEAQHWITYNFGAIPLLLVRDFNLLPQLPDHGLTLITSMFLHGGIFHIAGNMLYLWIFGNNVEDYLGHGKFILFYLVCGIAAALTHTLTQITSPVPMIGASGAISGILGAYVVLYPRARVVTMLWIFFFVRFVRIPAFIVLGIWFLMQLPGALGGQGGIAWFAHIGGFLFGLIFIRLWGGAPPRRQHFFG